MIGGENIAVPSRHVAFRLVSSRLVFWISRLERSRVEPSRVVAPCPQRDRAKAFSS